MKVKSNNKGLKMRKILIITALTIGVLSANFSCDYDLKKGMESFEIAGIHSTEQNWELFEFHSDLAKTYWINASVECRGDDRKNAKHGLKSVKEMRAYARKKGLIK